MDPGYQSCLVGKQCRWDKVRPQALHITSDSDKAVLTVALYCRQYRFHLAEHFARCSRLLEDWKTERMTP